MSLNYPTNFSFQTYDIKEIYNTKLLSFLLPIINYISIFTIILAALLIYVIITKSPKFVSNFRYFLLPYVVTSMLLELVILIFKPFLLYPFLAVYSLDGGNNNFSPNLILVSFILMAFLAMTLIDFIVGMSAERYFALRNVYIKKSYKAFIIFAFLSSSTFAITIICLSLIYFDSIRNLFILPDFDGQKFLNERIKNFNNNSSSLNFNSVAVFRHDISLIDLGFPFIIFLSFIFIRYFLAIIFFILNATNFNGAKVKISKKLKNTNQMLLYCTYAQFIGFCLFAGLPAFIIVILYYFISTPISLILYSCFFLMNCFGLYDICVTIIYIKPYRRFFIKLLSFKKYGNLQSTNIGNSSDYVKIEKPTPSLTPRDTIETLPTITATSSPTTSMEPEIVSESSKIGLLISDVLL